MNEGKPAKAKWWNRPRLQGHSSEPTADGDFELARPLGGGAADGDFELRPAGSGDDVASEGDFELARPAGVSVPASSEGTAGIADAVTAEPSEDARVETGPAVSLADSAASPPASPTPLHDPDPYSTPPYGEPGPWAPAPPVQHPATTPSHGTAVPMPPPEPAPAYGAQATAPASDVTAPQTTAAASAPVPPQATGLSTRTPPPAPAAEQAPGIPAPAPHPAPPAPAAPAPPSGIPAQETHPTAEAPTGSVPAQSAPQAPVQPAASTVAQQAPLAPARQAPPAPEAPTAPIPTQPAPQPPAQPAPPTAPTLNNTPTNPPFDPPPPTNPWQNYDPWSQTPHPTAPLQQTGAAVPSQAQRRSRGKKVLVVGGLLIALVAGGVGGVVGAYLERNGGVGDVVLPQAGVEAVGRAPDSVAGIAARALPSVVTLHVTGSAEQGTGTGFVLDGQGHILTNNHVVEPAGEGGEISVTFHSGDTAKATVVGRDSGYDLAVVKVSDVRGLKPLPLGNSDNVQVGDPVVAIGAPFDLEGTVTSGIISAKERPITAGGEGGDGSDGSDVSYVDALQTDAPINPGNSGGPLLDAEGRVVGINSAIRSADSGSDLDGGQAGSIGLGFAIPVNQAKRVAEELINTGRATHPVIGVTLDMDYAGDGARVGTKGSDGGSAVTAGGPGDKAGIEPGDVITQVDGQRVHSGEELIVKTRAHRPGDRLELTLERDGKEITIELTLGSSSGR
ncbi:trypsin-like peptidase domain-containing protein [Streptomyces lanatus]|uniref:Trypsin-like peptidase domain-containing protein n=1 Tax=Streptomyces lanatus TaxID=66900 RepID=A0ABV1XK81_9ACTN|nr:trypsin-like peptidase domain-containing protein [Streptomyces lanatus]GHG96120.1 hypothetical protein GCM10018780_20340 [Streptomyces lanatus]